MCKPSVFRLKSLFNSAEVLKKWELVQHGLCNTNFERLILIEIRRNQLRPNDYVDNR